MVYHEQKGTDHFLQSPQGRQFRCTLAGTVFAGGVNGVGEIAGHPALEQAYQMGKEV